MGMYTEFHFNSELKSDIADNIVNILECMLGKLSINDVILPDHPLFQTETRWETMLRCDSYYFDADTISTLRYDEPSNSFFLCIRCNFKNYANEIQRFIDWIHPYLAKEDGDFLGFSRYEETEIPTLIYY